MVLLCLPHYSVKFKILNHTITEQHLGYGHLVRNKPVDVSKSLRASVPHRRDSLKLSSSFSSLCEHLALLQLASMHSLVESSSSSISGRCTYSATAELQVEKEPFCVAGSKRFPAFPPVGVSIHCSCEDSLKVFPSLQQQDSGGP